MNRLNRLGSMLCGTIMVFALAACGERTSQETVTDAGLADAGTPAPPVTRLRGVQIMDESLDAPQLAYNVQVPEGWRSGGGVRWDDSAPCYADQVRVSWSARSPDDSAVFQVLPNFAWQVAGNGNRADPCPVAAYQSARQLLESAAAQARPHARILDYQDWAEKIAEMQHKMAAQAGGVAPGQELRVDAGHLLLGYAENGIEMREVLSAAVNFASRNGNTIGSTRQFTSYRAPEGQLDFALNDRIAGSLKPDPQWAAAATERQVRNVQRVLQARAGNQ